MDLAAKLIERLDGGLRRCRRGAALASAMFMLAASAILTAGVHWMTRVDVRTTANRQSAVRALTIAEAGASHALGIMRSELPDLEYTDFIRGPDTTSYNTSDDGILSGWTLTSANSIPAAGRNFAGGRYTVTVADDPAERDGNATRDSNNRVMLRCTGFGPDGSRAVLDVVVGGITMPGFVFDGPATFSGSAMLKGRCGGVHANGNINASGQIVTVNGQVSSTGTVSGTFKDVTTGVPVAPMTNQDTVAIVPLDAQLFCAGAKYRLRANGDVWDQSLNVFLGNAIAIPLLGWKRASGPPEVKWDFSSAVATDGSYCIEGNAVVSGGVGSALAPARWSLYALGSVTISGNPYLRSFDNDSIVIAANGDVKVSGNPSSGEMNYGGAIYAKYQCNVSGNPSFSGQLICDNDSPQPASATELATGNVISGNPTLTYDCNGRFNSTRRFVSWIQVPGT
jgi:hypothetical protein